MPPFFRHLVFFLLFLLACSRPNNAVVLAPAVEVDLELIQKRGYITALVDNNSFSYLIYKGRPIGYEYELLRLLAKELKVDLKIKLISGVENGIHQLNTGVGDVLAFPLTVTEERTQYVSFSRPLFNSYQVLVQRKPDNWKELKQPQIDSQVVRDPHALVGKEVHVMKSSSFAERLRTLSQELGAIHIMEDSANAETESLIKQVALGNIDYTVADHPIAMVNSNYYPNLDVSTILSNPQQIAWSVRKNSPALLNAINTWLVKIKKASTFMVIYNRYFKSPRTSLLRVNSDYSSLGGNKISRYDELIKTGAQKLGWDWRLLAAIIYRESKFVSNDESWAGARGLMQLMPETARRFGATNPDDPRQSIKAGVNYLRHLDKIWAKKISDPNERLKFVLASYNAGLSHIMDARKLAKKHGRDPAVWNDVEFYLLKKSDRAFYRDPVVTAGYCKCEEPVNYVKNVLQTFDEYKLHIAV
ncbi:MAG TPA: transporter substrate-binding domain-containing protein [Cyclobacteriaceae bacterium]|nr:transporter substrate-binding domain-containing protein [Cyclobacteriaceae bacterium]HMV10115.1 transporter substrate-binding domain-containing protein [Cyclobacteriaceae bacterium]HMV88668.1 transporter substrate-binding domain-containing protein [Cyclobacteriaceae bacterium]HMX00570.1 transporter substrate-binding domain-containing protein [Cyclobacteriaceae bacterium]HMX49555.1 transporter substrate-binding domain-containing protein [Cyclobacteriaceae bacterium]